MSGKTFFMTILLILGIFDLRIFASSCTLYLYIGPLPIDAADDYYQEGTGVLYEFDTNVGTSNQWELAPFQDMIKIFPGFRFFSAEGEECSKCSFSARRANDINIPQLTNVKLAVDTLYESPYCVKAFHISC